MESEMKVHYETLRKVEGTQYLGEVEVEVRGKRSTLKCMIHGDHITVFGLGVRFPTGAKVWRGEATFWPSSGNVNNLRASSQDRRRNSRCVSLVGFYEDVAETRRSQHVAE